MPRRNLWIIFLAAVVSLACYHKAERNRYAAVFGKTLSIIDQNYVGDVDQRKLFDSAMESMVGELDQYSGYIKPENYKPFQATIDQEFVGIGVEVRIVPETSRLTVINPLIGSPALKAGLRAGDQILEIDGKSTDGVDLKDAVKLIQGKQGTPVTLSVLHRGSEEPVDIRVVRDKIQVDSVLGDTRQTDGKWNFFLERNPRIGYVRVTSFGQRTSEELTRALKSIEPTISGLILDLRHNPGGLLTEAVQTCDLFIDQGKIVTTSGKQRKLVEEASPENTIAPADLPIVVLVNHGSASASEIVAACLQDHQRAVIIGERTWGKGTVQNVIDLEGGRSALKLTIAKYLRPNGHNIHRTESNTDEDEWGVMPDSGFLVELTKEQTEDIYQARRERDVFQTADQPRNSDGPIEIDPPVDDPQLQKAVEYLEEQIHQIDAQGSKA